MVEIKSESGDHSSSITVDQNHPFFVHYSESSNFELCTKLLNGENYSHWRRSAEVSLSARNKLDIVRGKYPEPSADDPTASYWERCNNTVISWLLHSIEPEISESVIYCTTAQEIWEELELRYGKDNAPSIFQQEKDINMTTQGSNSVSVYFARLKSLWDEYSAMVKTPACTCSSGPATIQLLQQQKLMHFLMRLNEDYRTVRGNILMMSPLPPVSQAYSLVLQKEKQR